MTASNSLYEHYLTNYYASYSDSTAHRARLKAGLAVNVGRFVPSDRAAAILEIGPGYGELLELLARDKGYSSVHTIDLSPEVVAFCNSLVPGSAEVVEDTTQYLQARAGQYDFIVLMDVLEHVPKASIIELLEAAWSALKPGGRIFVQVPNMGNPYIGLNVRYADFTHEIGFTDMSLAFVLKQAGFQNVSVTGYQQPPSKRYNLIQRPLQFVIENVTRLIYRAYASQAPQVLAGALCAVAEK